MPPPFRPTGMTAPPGLDAALPDAGMTQLERWLQRATEGIAALAVLAEVAILFAGVTARFAFAHPLVWSDELASILFLWLAMFGAAVALRHGQHMRLGFLAARLPPRWQGWAEALAVAAPALFLLIVMQPAIDYAHEQAAVQTPALGWSGLVRALAMPVGCLLILAECVVRLLRRRPADLIGVALLLAAVAAVLFLATPTL
ncbi:MAG TPA: TRAP transporter small permease, partial [Acetobacteraceae bacterium]|nr:TRAP transporter small permease [Acetobacteraceae bacterium]